MSSTTATTPFELSYDPWGRLVYCDASGSRQTDVAAVRLFPYSDPERWIAIRDAEGRELSLVENPAELPPAVRETLLRDLASREFIPIIAAIYRVSALTEPCEWEVDTDRGRKQFVLKSDEDVRRLGPDRALIVDAQGIRYLIPQISALNSIGRRAVEWYL